MKLFDAGVNLLDGRFSADEVIQRANDAGVARLCIITTHPSEWDDAYQLYLKYPDICSNIYRVIGGRVVIFKCDAIYNDIG